MHVLLKRYAYTKMGTFGVLSIVDCDEIVFECLTVERPWLNNEPRVSCIPEGTYVLELRVSEIVYRTSKEEFEKGFEICDVPDRTFIMIHVANSMDDLQGCVGVGSSPAWIHHKWAVGNSRVTFQEFMYNMHLVKEDHTIEISFDKHAMDNYR